MRAVTHINESCHRSTRATTARPARKRVAAAVALRLSVSSISGNGSHGTRHIGT